MNWLDILFAAVIVWNLWSGFTAGLVVGLARLLGLLLGFAAALNFYRPLADAVNLKWNIVSVIGTHFPSLGGSPGGPAYGPRSPVEIFFPPAAIDAGAAASNKVFYGLQGIGDSVTRMLASGILDIICFFVIFLVVSKLIVIAGVVVARVSKMLFLGPLDRLGGLLMGLVKGGVIVAVLVAAIVSLQLPAAYISSGEKTSFLSLALQNSLLTPYFLKAMAFLKISFPGWPV